MGPRSNDNNASSTKQKKKSDSPPVAPLEAPPAPAASSPLSQPITAPVPAPAPSPSSISTPAPAPAPAQAQAQAQLKVQPTQSTPATHDVRSISSASATSNPRVFTASTLKPTSAIDTVTSTISAISQHANRGISSLIAAHSNAPNPASPLATASADHSTPPRTDGSVSPIYDAFHNAGSPPDPARIEAALHHAHQSEQAARALLPRVLWSRWDRLPLKAHPPKWAPLLISYFDDGTLQALLVQDRQISELLCLPNAAEILHDQAALSTGARILTALVRHPTSDSIDPQLLLIVQEPDNSATLLAYSLAAHQVQASVHLQHHSAPTREPTEHIVDPSNDLWPQVESQCNERFLVLSFASPASIHVLSTSSLEYAHSPILDVSAAFDKRPSPISLSHRLLAFACTSTDNISPIRSDTRKISNASYHDPSRPFAATQADASGRVGEMRDNLFETSAQVGDAARRIRGGVMTGVRTLGEWGSSYWPQAGSPPTTAAFSPPQPSLLSQSAPHTAHSPRPASSASISPMLLAADNGRSAKRLSTGAAAVTSIKSDTVTSSSNSANAVQAGCVRVVDLCSDARTVCTFAPSSNAVTLVSFSPCGRLVLTADTLGHAFHVFELPLSGTFGSASYPSSSAVLHRYKLMRGITTADVVHAEWSPDAQWVAVGTRSGTVHTYAVNPFGGFPSIANHVQRKVKNPHVLQPFGFSLASLARSARPSPSTQQDALAKSGNVPGAETGAAATAPVQTGFAPPSFLLISSGVRGVDADGEASSPFELLTSDSRSASVTLHVLRCWSTQTRVPSATTSSEDVHATSPEAKQRFAAATSPRSSGLSQMMRKAGEGLLHSQQVPRLQAECVRIALWDQLAPEAGAVTKQSVSALLNHAATSGSLDRSVAALPNLLASVAKAEIETYSQSPAILPSSIFLSRQTFFHARTRNNSSKQASAQAGSAELMRCVQRRGSRPIQVRRTAKMVSREPSSEDPSSFDDSLAGALDQMSFDPEKLPPRSASAHIPSFPQGQRGRSSGWTTGSSIPIRIVAGGLGGIYRASKELGRGVEMARRRTSGASGTAPPDGSRGYATNAASVSFDGVDDVDLLGDDEEGDRSARRPYRRSAGAASHADLGSMRSDTSMVSALRNDEPLRASQPSSAETPSTRFSEAEDPATDGMEADADECDWDAIEASRSPAAPEASLFGIMDDVDGQPQEGEESNDVSVGHSGNSLDDDFTMGMLEEDSGEATMAQSHSSLSPAQDIKSKVHTPKELVYALPAGGSARSSLLSQSSGLTATLESRVEAKGSQPSQRDSSPSNTDGGDSGSQTSAGSGMLCEGSKETHTTDSSPVALVSDLENSPKSIESKLLDVPIVAKPISISGGGKKKKKKVDAESDQGSKVVCSRSSCIPIKASSYTTHTDMQSDDLLDE